MAHYKSAYELGLDALDLDLCLDMENNQADYDGSRQPDSEPPEKEPAEKEPPDETTMP